MVISPSVCKAVALFAPARQTELSGCSAPAPPKIFLPLTDGAEYLMVTTLPPMVAEVSFGGLAWPNATPATTASARRLVIARSICIFVSILPLALHHDSGAC